MGGNFTDVSEVLGLLFAVARVPYWKSLLYESWAATWELVVGEPLARLLILGAIVITTVVVYRRWKRLEDYWATLRGSLAFILSSGLFFALIFIVQVLFITPKRIVDRSNRDKESAERAANDAQAENRKLRTEGSTLTLDVHEKDLEARQKLLEQQTRIEDLQSELKDANATIERLKPVKRFLTHDQREKLVAALKDGVDHTIAIRRDPQTPETQDYSDQFESVFKEAGWTINASPAFLIHLRAEKGIHILVRDIRYPPQDANMLYRAMLEAGIAVTGSEAPPLGADLVELVIGFPDDVMQPSPTPSMEASPP